MNQQARYAQAATIVDNRRLGGGTYNGFSKEVLDHTIYDTLCFSTTLPTQNFFELGRGKTLAGTSVTKTLAHTNLAQGNRLPAGHQYLIKGMGINFVKRVVDSGETAVGAAAAFVRVLQASNFRLKFPGRDFDFETAGDAWLPTICVQDIKTEVSTVTASSATRIGDFVANKILPLRNQIVIGSVEGSPVDFSVEWFVDTNDSGVSAALTTLTGTTPDALKFSLVGTLEKLK